MNPLHLIKALLVSIPEAFRRRTESPVFSAPPARPARPPFPPWIKAAAVVALLAVAAAFVVSAHRKNFGDRPPAWLKIETRTSPALASSAFAFLREECAREAARRRLPFGAVRVLVISNAFEASLRWSTETIRNPGFAPMTRYEQMTHPRRDAWIGFYRLDGAPMRYSLRPSLMQTNSVFLALHLDPPLAPGATQTVVRVSRAGLRLRPNRAGNFEVRQGGVPLSSGVSGVGIVLPPNGEYVGMTPSGHVKKNAGAPALVYWINPPVNSNAPPLSVEFHVQ